MKLTRIKRKSPELSLTQIQLLHNVVSHRHAAAKIKEKIMKLIALSYENHMVINNNILV